VGVDLEVTRDEVAWAELADTVFTPQEQRRLAEMDPSVAQAAGFTFWTRKEAVAKAVGEGLQACFRQLDVSDTPLPRGEWLSVTYKSQDETMTRWWVHDLRPGAGYVGAVASPVWPRQLRLLTWAPGG
jgi:4'-phosphopantetheinyl transferase